MDDIKLAGKKQNINPTWKILTKDVDLEWTIPKMAGQKQNHFLTMFILVALNENAKQAKIFGTITGLCLNPGCQLEVQNIFIIQRNLKQTFPHGPTTWKVMRRNAWKDCELANKTTQPLHKVATP